MPLWGSGAGLPGVEDILTRGSTDSADKGLKCIQTVLSVCSVCSDNILPFYKS